jgi:hypothetical protein
MMRAWKQVVAVAIAVMANAAMAFGAGAQTAASPAVAELAFKDGKTHFRSGEPMVLEITYRPGADGCFLVSDTQPSPMDVVELTPTEGAFRWMQGNGAGSDASMWSQLKANTPALSQLTLNDLYRFDQRGTYTVKVRTSHLRCGEFMKAKPQELTTNAVTFDVEPFAEADEKALAESLEQRIRASKNEFEADKLAKQLSYLPGDDATRAKLSLTLHQKTFYPFGVNLGASFWIARNREMVLNALEQAIDDPSQPDSARLIPMLLELKRDPAEPEAHCCASVAPTHPLKDTLAASYMHEVAASLPKRTGESRIDAALSVFEADAHGAESDPALQSDFQQAREIVITHFGEINEYNVAYVLKAYGKYLQDPRLVPDLQKLIDRSEGIFSDNRVEAMKQLNQIAPEGLDRYLVHEACTSHPALMQEVRDLTATETLPEVDGCLGERLQKILSQPAGTRMDLALESTLEYIARFADAALIPEVLKAYVGRAPDDKHWSRAARGAALCYLMRWDAKDASSLLAEWMPDAAHPVDTDLLDVVGPAMPSAEALREYFRHWIETGTGDAGMVVFVLSQIGNADDRVFLKQRLDKLHTKEPSAFTEANGRLETELVTAQIRGRTWDYSYGEVGKEIARSECQTLECKKYFNVE